MNIMEHELERKREALRTAIIWKYTLKDMTVNSFRLPKGSWFAGASSFHGRPALAFAIPDPLADYETRYFAMPDNGLTFDSDGLAKYLVHMSIGDGSRSVYEVKYSHPIVYKNLR